MAAVSGPGCADAWLCLWLRALERNGDLSRQMHGLDGQRAGVGVDLDAAGCGIGQSLSKARIDQPLGR